MQESRDLVDRGWPLLGYSYSDAKNHLMIDSTGILFDTRDCSMAATASVARSSDPSVPGPWGTIYSAVLSMPSASSLLLGR